MGFAESLKRFFFSEGEDVIQRNIGRNDTCWCGSGEKYKKCCLRSDEEKMSRSRKVNCGTS